MTLDVAHKTSGAQVVLSTSSDPRHPPENIIDGDKSSFWVSTGLFPQEIIISFQSQVIISAIQIYCFNVKELIVERSVKADPVDFELVCERDLAFTDTHLQKEEIKVQCHDQAPTHSMSNQLFFQIQADSTSASHLRFLIKTGHDHFISVHSIIVQGTIVH
jgi:heat shock protein beta-11